MFRITRIKKAQTQQEEDVFKVPRGICIEDEGENICVTFPVQ